MKKYLPIGSVVLLTNSKKRVMIIGYKPTVSGNDKVWDYSGCLFPEGVIDANKLFVFDDTQIERLYFIGLQDSESLTFLKALADTDKKDEDDIF